MTLFVPLGQLSKPIGQIGPDAAMKNSAVVECQWKVPGKIKFSYNSISWKVVVDEVHGLMMDISINYWINLRKAWPIALEYLIGKVGYA